MCSDKKIRHKKRDNFFCILENTIKYETKYLDKQAIGKEKKKRQKTTETVKAKKFPSLEEISSILP